MIHNSKLWKQQRCPLPTNALRKCGMYTQWKCIQPQRKMKFSHPQVNSRDETGEYCLKLIRIRRPKITCSSSYVYFRPKTNAVILLDMGHTLRDDHACEE
jgi:hypothetical protein